MTVKNFSRIIPTGNSTSWLDIINFHRVKGKHIRTSNVIERAFKEVKRVTNVIGRFPNETSALVMVFSILEKERLKWHKVRRKIAGIIWVEAAATVDS